MKKYLKRWKKLTDKQRFAFLNAYLHNKNMCSLCIMAPNYDGDRESRNCSQCRTMFPQTDINERYSWREKCPCNQYTRSQLKDHPPTVIEYCLIHDGWIEKE